MNAKQVYHYASRFASRAEASGRGTQYPSVRQAARRFRCKIADVLECVESADARDVGGNYFALAVGIRAGGGVGSFDSEGDYLIEAY